MSKNIDELVKILNEAKVQVTLTGWKAELEACEKELMELRSTYERVKAEYAVLADMSKTQQENFTTAIKERDDARAEVRLGNTILEQLQRANKASDALQSAKSARLVEVLLQLKSWGYQTQFETIDKALAEFKEESAG